MKTLVYINPDCYLDTDLTVLGYLGAHFRVVWIPVYYTDRPIYYTPAQMAEFAGRHRIEFHPRPRLFRQRDPRNLGFYRSIAREIRDLNPDLIYSCITEELWWTLSLPILRGIPFVQGLHDVVKHSYSAAFKRFIQSGVQKITIKGHPNVCVFSEGQRELFIREYGRLAVNLGMSCKDFGPSMQVPPPFGAGIKLLFFGAISKYKGLANLISAIEALPSEDRQRISLTVAGKGEDWPMCEAAIRTRELYDLRIRFIDNSEIPDLMCSHHFLALPYTDATQSGPLLVAANYGLPVLAPFFGCFRELYDDGSGVLYSELRQGLARILSMTPGVYADMKAAALKLKERFSEKSVADKYVSYFNSLI